MRLNSSKQAHAPHCTCHSGNCLVGVVEDGAMHSRGCGKSTASNSWLVETIKASVHPPHCARALKQMPFLWCNWQCTYSTKPHCTCTTGRCTQASEVDIGQYEQSRRKLSKAWGIKSISCTLRSTHLTLLHDGLTVGRAPCAPSHQRLFKRLFKSRVHSLIRASCALFLLN